MDAVGRPIVGVILCSKARLFSAASTLSTSSIKKIAGPLELDVEAGVEDVRRGHALVNEARLGPTISDRWVRNAMTSCLTSRSISSIRSTSKGAVAPFPRRYRRPPWGRRESAARRRMGLDLEPDPELVSATRWRPFPGGCNGGSSTTPGSLFFYAVL